MSETKWLADFITRLAVLKEEFVAKYAEANDFGSKRNNELATDVYVSLGEMADRLKDTMDKYKGEDET